MSPRPELPYDLSNPKLANQPGLAVTLPPVKYQVLNSGGVDILVGRLKVETPDDGHAFILRRYDTQAVSFTTMYRAAFPGASTSQESGEISYVKASFDLHGNNGSKTEAHIPRLAGTWVKPADALILAEDYQIRPVVQIIVDASPDPNTSYRRSKNKTEATTPSKVPATPPTLAGASSIVVPASLPPLTSNTSPLSGPAPAKRRKEASPVPSPAPPSTKASRRSTRATKSPPPSRNYSSITAVASRKTPTRSVKTKIKSVEAATPGGSDGTVVDEDSEAVIDTAAGEELHKQDVSEQKELISRLKEEMGSDMAVISKVEKREREEDDQPLTLNIKEPETEQRAISSNSRIRRINLDTKQKSVAWGVAAFFAGVGAMYLPSLF